MKLLIAVMTCHRLDYYIDDLTIDWCTQKNLRCTDQQARVTAIRDTWIKEIPSSIGYRFFYGTRLRQGGAPPRAPASDEVFLNCGDNYTENPAKMKAICQWAIDHGYDYILRCDDDTFIYPDRLLVTNWAEYDYSGSCATNDFHPGGCMFLSRRMMELIITSKVTTYADDVWIGQISKQNKIPMNYIPNTRNQWGTGYKVPIDVDPTGIASFHSCDPNTMRRLYVAGQQAPAIGAPSSKI